MLLIELFNGHKTILIIHKTKSVSNQRWTLSGIGRSSRKAAVRGRVFDVGKLRKVPLSGQYVPREVRACVCAPSGDPPG